MPLDVWTLNGLIDGIDGLFVGMVLAYSQYIGIVQVTAVNPF